MPSYKNVLQACSIVFVAGLSISADARASEPLKCETGPVTRNFGKTPWLVYACDDRRSLVIVPAPGNPAMPFYFMFAANGKGFNLSGEGTGSKAASAAAMADLERLSDTAISALGADVRRSARR